MHYTECTHKHTDSNDKDKYCIFFKRQMKKTRKKNWMGMGRILVSSFSVEPLKLSGALILLSIGKWCTQIPVRKVDDGMLSLPSE